jgi:WD40 repeat protein
MFSVVRLLLPLVLLTLTGAVLLGSGAAATRSTLPVLVTVSPDGTRIAWSDGFDWQVSVANSDGSDERAVGVPFADGIGQLTWTRFGLIADSNYTLTLLTRAGKRTRIGVVGDQQFSVGGAHAASGAAGCGYCHGPISVYNIRTHTVARLGDPKRPNGDAALSPDGASVAYYGPHGLVVQAAAGGPARRLRTTGSCNISWSPDGRTLALGSTGISTVPATGGRTVSLVKPSRGYACVGGYVPAWSPDASEILFGRLSGGSGSSQPIGQLAVVDLRTHTMRQTAKRLGTLSSYAWSPDGKSIFAAFRTGDCGTIWHLDEATLTGDAVYKGCG